MLDPKTKQKLSFCENNKSWRITSSSIIFVFSFPIQIKIERKNPIKIGQAHLNLIVWVMTITCAISKNKKNKKLRLWLFSCLFLDRGKICRAINKKVSHTLSQYDTVAGVAICDPVMQPGRRLVTNPAVAVFGWNCWRWYGKRFEKREIVATTVCADRFVRWNEKEKQNRSLFLTDDASIVTAGSVCGNSTNNSAPLSPPPLFPPSLSPPARSLQPPSLPSTVAQHYSRPQPLASRWLLRFRCCTHLQQYTAATIITNANSNSNSFCEHHQWLANASPNFRNQTHFQNQRRHYLLKEML